MKNTSAIKEKTTDLLFDIRNLYRKLDIESNINSYKSATLFLLRETINISIIGSSNSGKSTLVNALLKKQIAPVSILPNEISLSIGAAKSSEIGFFYKKTWYPLKDFSSIEPDNKSHLEILIKNNWLNDNGIVIQEKQGYEKLSKNIDLNNLLFFKDTDIVVFLIDSLMPLTKTEISFLSVCKNFDIPTLISLTKLDKIEEGDDDERKSVTEYVRKNLNKISKKFVFIEPKANSAKIDLAKPILDILKKVLSNQNFPNKRLSLLNLLFIQAYNEIKNNIIAKQNKLNTKIEKIKYNAKKEEDYLENQDLEWERIGGKLSELRQNIEKKVRTHLVQNRENILIQLKYELERTNDVKTWWEKDLKYSLEREILNTVNKLNQGVNRQLSDGMQWLQAEIDKFFNYKITSYPRFEILIEDDHYKQKEIILTDNGKLKIITRVGTAATVIAAGALFATSGVIGIVIAITTVGGLGAEYLINFNSKKDKEKVSLELSKIIEKAEVEYTVLITSKLKEVFEQIIENIKDYHLDWKEKKMNEISDMRNQKITNISNEKNWNELIKHIDKQLSELVKSL